MPNQSLIATQEAIMQVLGNMGHERLVMRLMACTKAHTARSRRAWPWRCRSAGCAWCGPPSAQRWWRGLSAWAATVPSSTLRLKAFGADPLPVRARRLRRALRDLRDRRAHRDARWREVAFAGMIADDGLHLLVRHGRLTHDTFVQALGRRFPAMTDVASSPPNFAFGADDAAALAVARRGVESLRVVIMPQRVRDGSPLGDVMLDVEPLPFVIASWG